MKRWSNTVVFILKYMLGKMFCIKQSYRAGYAQLNTEKGTVYFAGRIGRSWIEGIYVDIHGYLGAPHAGPHAVKGMNQQPVYGSFRYIFFY